MSTTAFNDFISKYLVLSPSSLLKRTEIRELWTEINNGSTGILKLYKHMSETDMPLTKTHLIGYKLATPVETSVAAPVAAPIEIIDSYKQMKIDLMKKKMEEKRIIEANRIALEKEKNEQDRMLVEKKMEEKRIIEANRIALEKEKLEQERILEEKKMEFKKYKTDIFVEQSEKNRAHCSMENNKNRLLSMYKANAHPYLDVIAYGNAGYQGITSSSAKTTMSTQILLHTNLNENDDIKMAKVVNDAVNKVVEEKLIINDIGVKTPEQMIPSREYVGVLSNVLTTLADLALINSTKREWVEPVADRISIIDGIADRITADMSVPSYRESMKLIQASKNNSKKDKDVYIKPLNDCVFDQTASQLSVACYACSAKTLIKDMGLHRCHNLPESEGGKWDKSNIFLCCATCNLNMSNNQTVEEYKCTLVSKRADKVVIEFTLVDTSSDEAMDNTMRLTDE